MISKEEHILLNAEKLFAEKGFDGTSTREISKEANVNVSMISYYFGSKEKLFQKIFEYRMAEGLNFAKNVLENKELNAWEKISLVIDRYAERVKKYRIFYLIFQREQLNMSDPEICAFLKNSKMSFLSMYNKIVEEGRADKIFTKNPRLEFIHSTVSGTLFTSMNSMALYREFQNGGDDFEEKYYNDLKKHIKEILKYLLGYEQTT